MPVNVVRTPEEEMAWERAKARVRQEYPEASGAQFYRLVMTIYKKIAQLRAHNGQARLIDSLMRGECDDQGTDSKS